MRLDPSEVIAGIPILEVRRLFRDLNAGMRLKDVAELLNLEARAARELVAELQRLDLLARVHRNPDAWAPTPKGNALAGAKALPPMTRKTAEELLAKFLQRVQQVNASDEYLYTVARVDVFGSYLSDQPTLNDLDLAIDLQPRGARSRQTLRCMRGRESRRLRCGSAFPIVCGPVRLARGEGAPLPQSALPARQLARDRRTAAARYVNQNTH